MLWLRIMDIYKYWKDKIKPIEKYICPHCKSKHSLDEWNDCTMVNFHDTDIRPMIPQDFNELGESNIVKMHAYVYYCPSCNMPTCGNEIRRA